MLGTAGKLAGMKTGEVKKEEISWKWKWAGRNDGSRERGRASAGEMTLLRSVTLPAALTSPGGGDREDADAPGWSWPTDEWSVAWAPVQPPGRPHRRHPVRGAVGQVRRGPTARLGVGVRRRHRDRTVLCRWLSPRPHTRSTPTHLVRQLGIGATPGCHGARGRRLAGLGRQPRSRPVRPDARRLDADLHRAGPAGLLPHAIATTWLYITDNHHEAEHILVDVLARTLNRDPDS